MAVDWVALAAVVVSGGVAVSATAERLISGKSQRNHERGVAFDDHSWEDKKTAMHACVDIGFDVVAACDKWFQSTGGTTVEQLDDALRLSLSRCLKEMDGALSGTKIYGNVGCFDALVGLHAMLDNAPIARLAPGVDQIQGVLDDYPNWRHNENAEDRRIAIGQANRSLFADARGVTIDPDKLSEWALQLMNAARESMRDPS